MQFFKVISDESKNQEERLAEIIWRLKEKGCGDKRQELTFFKKFFKEFFKAYPDVFSLHWSQYQDFDDHKLYFDIWEIHINEHIRASVYGFADWDEYEWDYLIEAYEEWKGKKEDYSSENDFYDSIDQFIEHFSKTTPLRKPIDVILIFLLAAYRLYGTYYFIYLFGRRAKVRIDRAGIHIKTDEVEYINGDDFDKSFNIPY